MLKKTVTCEDYNGVERTEDYYFNLSEAEIVEMELGTTGGYAETVQAIIQAKDTSEIMKLFKELLLKSYGEKSADGKRFIKTDPEGRPLSIAFSQTQAYSKIFMELATDADAGAAFVNGILPADLVKQANQKALEQASK